MIKQIKQLTEYNILSSLIQSNLIKDDRIKKCSSNVIYSNKKTIGYDFKTIPFQCHLHKVCPVCKVKKTKEYREQDLRDYRRLMEYGETKNKPEVLRLTLTLKSYPNNNLHKQTEILNKCFNDLTRSYIWKKIKKENQQIFMVKVMEIKSTSNKFNPHFHIHLGLKNKTMTNTEMRNSLRETWIRITKKHKLTSLYGVHIITLKDQSSLDYIRKIEHEVNTFNEIDEQLKDSIDKNSSEGMRKLLNKQKSKDITHPRIDKSEQQQSYSSGELEIINHHYTKNPDYKHSKIAHKTVKNQLKQIYGYLGGVHTKTTTRSYSDDFFKETKEKRT